MRSSVINTPNRVCGPGGAVEEGHVDIQTLHKELMEESLSMIAPKCTLEWNLFMTTKTKTGKTASSYWTDGTDLTITGPAPNHEFEVNIAYDWQNIRALGKHVEPIENAGHAWMSLANIAATKYEENLFAPAFLAMCKKLDSERNTILANF